MTKQHLRISEGGVSQTTWQLGWEALVYFFVSMAMGVLAWVYPQMKVPPGILPFWALSAGEILGFLVIHSVLTTTIEHNLAYTPIRRDWRYRLAFFVSGGLGCIRWVTLVINPAPHPRPFWLITVLVGAYLGGLLATSLNEGLWENNSPPSEHIQAEVHQRHLEYIGLPGAERASKRLFDFCLAILGLVIFTPLWLLGSFLVWIENPGPILFVKNSVGKGGRNIYQFKFRTMVLGAEEHTGPVLADEQDDRVLMIGRFLRKTALDELPQLINILRGEMSFVGPRPQRTVLVHGYLERIPEYAERHSVLPGLSGLAQVAGDYYLTPRQKLRLDRLYIRYSGLGFDLKLLFLAFLITFWFRWQKGWNGRLPRKMLRFGSRPEVNRDT
ncbi:MAG TPA: sugar transferase [bacterium]|nr:sugar transferase [bacterium]